MSLTSFMQFIFSRPEGDKHRMRFADLFHTYREFIAQENLPNVKNNVYEEEKYLLSVLTTSLLSALSVIQGDKQEFLIRRYLQTVVEQLRRPAYPENYPSDTVSFISALMMDLFGPPPPAKGVKFIKENPMSLEPFPKYETVQHYVKRICAEDHHDQYLNSVTLGLYSFLLTIREEENASELVSLYLQTMMQLEMMPAGADSYDYPEKTIYQLRF